MSAQPIPVTVIGGYLGAGKTTLVNHVLRASDERVAVIVNDFGEISIDEDLIVAADGDKLTLANGCICCTLADGFAAALMQVRSAPAPPDRLLIEASGVADPAQIAAYGHTPGLRLDAVVVLADAEQVRRQANDRWVADTVRMQLAAADLLVVNKIDLLSDTAAADDLCDWLTEIAHGTALVRVSRAAVPIALLFGPRPNGDVADAPGPIPSPREGTQTGSAAPTAEDLFESQTVVLDTPVPMPLIEALLTNLPESVVRLKGLVQTVPDVGHASSPDEPTSCLIEAVGARTSMTPWRSDPATPPARWPVSLIARRGALPPNWLQAQLHL